MKGFDSLEDEMFDGKKFGILLNEWLFKKTKL